MAESPANDPRPQGEHPAQPRSGLVLGIIALGAIIVIVLIFLLIRGMQDPGAIQDVDEPGEAPTEQPQTPGQDPGPIAMPLSLVE